MGATRSTTGAPRSVFGHLDLDISATEGCAVHGGQRLLGLIVVVERYEAKAPGPSGLSVVDYYRVADRSKLLEGLS